MNLGRSFAKSLLSNGSLWFWAVAFMAMWLGIGAFLESQGVGPERAAIVAYTTSWYAVIVLIGLSLLAAAIAGSIVYSSSSLAYAFRWTRLTPSGYLGSIVVGSSVLGVVLNVVLLGATAGMFGWRFSTAVLPVDPLGLVGVSLLGGVFYMALAATLSLVVINYLGLRSSNFIGYVPLLLSFVLGNAQLYVALPRALVYASPFNDLLSLLYQGYSGATPTVQLGASSAPLAWVPLLLGVLLWTGAFAATTLGLLRRIRARHLEEGRQV
jgi:hypothetical protein